ncbi:MAG: hypothetical protein ACI8X5_002649 [Planctomycetota bacterium]|jgi:hypothetical protein
MNNFKFIARYMAAAAIFTGVSSQVYAQDCTVNVTCPVNGTILTDEQTGEREEDFLTHGALESISVPKFDKVFIAQEAGVAVSKVKLLGVEYDLEVTISVMEWVIENTDTACTWSWTWQPSMILEEHFNPDTPAVIALPPEQVQLPIDLPEMQGVVYTWDLATNGVGTDANGNISGMECGTATENLDDWTGAGFIDWSLRTLNIPDPLGCGNADVDRNVKGSAIITVRYKYCIEGEEIEGCECPNPSPNYRKPGSLLLFPEYDTRVGKYTLISVTNVDCINTAGENVDIEFVFIDGDDCSENNRTLTLTPCDTVTLLAHKLNPNPETGYLYVFAKEYVGGGATNGDAISWNHLIGNEMIIDGFEFYDYSMNPVSFTSPVPEGERTDEFNGFGDGDGYRDLDGTEYAPAPNIITIPRFFGQDGMQGDAGSAYFNSQLILIALTGGAQFDTTACILYYNDNEQVFSTEYEFHCWEKPYLLDIDQGFGNDWLANNTDDDPDEIFGLPLGANRESGWMCIEGCAASSTQESIANPAIYAALVEHVGNLGIADLPFECGIRTNGALVPRGVFGDPDIDNDGDGQVDDGDAQDDDDQ